MASKKKPVWPLILSGIFVLGICVVLLKDWERYPTQVEMERYLTNSHSNVEQVKVLKMEEFEDAYEKAMIYELEYHYEEGRIVKETFSIRSQDRKRIYPWHDYYEGQYQLRTD